MKKIITVYVYASFLMGALSPTLTASYVTLPNSTLTLNDHSKYTRCNHDNKLTYLSVVRTAARYSFDADSSDAFISILNNTILRHDSNPNCKISEEEYRLLQQCLTQLKEYISIKHHQFKMPVNVRLSNEELLQEDIHYGIALIEAIINAAHERSK